VEGTDLNSLTPFRRFCNGLHHARKEFNENVDEMLAFAEVMALKQNCVELDENGVFYVSAAGTIDEVIPVMHAQLDRLKRIREERNNPH
jgi:hypothetical protein